MIANLRRVQDAEKTPEPPSAAAVSVRPKAFRRPPGWVAPAAQPTPPTPASASVHRLPVRTDITDTHTDHGTPARESSYSILLVVAVLAINLVAAALLQAWQQNDKPRYGSTEAASGGPFISDAAQTPRNEVTLFASPINERRTLTAPPVDAPIDATDAITHPPANPDDDQ